MVFVQPHLPGGPNQGEVTPIGAVSRAATGVKMRSNDQGTFWGLVKRSSSVLGHYLRRYWRSRGVVDPFAHAQLVKGQGQKSGVVKRLRSFFDGQKS